MNPLEVMSALKKRITYLQGLALGLNISIHSAEGKVLVYMIDILADLAEMVTKIQSEQDDFKIYVDSIDDDLTSLENMVYVTLGQKVITGGMTVQNDDTGTFIAERNGEACFKAKD